MVVFWQRDCFWAKVIFLRAKSLYSGKSGCNWANWLYSAKVVVFVKSSFFRIKLLYSGQVALFWQSACIRAKWLFLKKKLMYSGKVVLFEQMRLFSGK